MMFLAWAAAAAMLALPQSKKDPKQEFQTRWTAVAKKVAQRHLAFARRCTEKKVHEMAWEELLRAVELDPNYTDAQLALGRKIDKEKGGWVDTAASKAKKNEGSPADLKLRLKECADERAAMSAKAIGDLEPLAIWADTNQLAEDAKQIWTRILREYDPSYERAMKATGWEFIDGRWVSPEDIAKRGAGKKALAETSDGEAVKDPSPLERAMGVTLAKRKSAHFYLEGTHTEEEMQELTRICEATRAMYMQAFHLDEKALRRTMRGTFFVDKGQYVAFIDRGARVPPQEREDYKKINGYVTFGQQEFVNCQDKTEFAAVKDDASHMTAHLLLHEVTGLPNNPPWLQEGLGYWFTERLLQTALTRCIRSETSTGDVRGSLDVLDWKRQLKEEIASKTCPSLRDVMFSQMTTLSTSKVIKAWSVIDFFLSRQVGEFAVFLANLKARMNQEEAMTKAFDGKSLVDIDALWLAYAKETY